MPRNSKFMNVGQAANYLGVSAASLRNWSNRGLVAVYRTPGGQRRYDATDLDDFMHSMRESVGNGGHPLDDREQVSREESVSGRA
jgi:excisionase family DNA binding protein